MQAHANPAHAGQATRIFATLTIAYVASQFFRVSNAVIAPELMSELAIEPEAMGAVTGAFFLTFGIMQLPTGIALDRFGPRRTMSVYLVLAAIGSALFAIGSDTGTLALARALIGVGCAAGLMGAMVAISRWYPPHRFASMSSLLFSVGGIGTLIATTPLALMTEMIGWRGAFWLMAGVTLLLSIALYVVVRDRPAPAEPSEQPGHKEESIAEIFGGLRAVLANRGIWHCSALQFANYATVLAITGLWAGPYLNDVFGLDGVLRGNLLMLINVCTLIGVMAYSQIERLVDSRRSTIVAGMLVSSTVLLILAWLPFPPLWLAVTLLSVFAFSSSVVMLIHAHARAMLPDRLIGRGLTVQNLAVFLGVAFMQWAGGRIIGSFELFQGATSEHAYQAVFAFFGACAIVATLIYMPIRDVRPSKV